MYQRYKNLKYSYDLVSGNVKEVVYQQGQPDQFYHKYEYDADNRIVSMFTSSDRRHWDRDAKYSYYQHGPLARTELGEQKVQGLDYAYTIQGWIKGVNSNSLNATRDIGKDGATATGNPNQYVAADQMGYSLVILTAIIAALAQVLRSEQQPAAGWMWLVRTFGTATSATWW
jgi:hypothetical protein